MTRVRINDAAIDVAVGTTLLDAVEAAAVPIASECGGSGRCGLCRVRVVSGSSRLSPMDRVEREALGDEAGDKARLACRAVVTQRGALRIAVPSPSEVHDSE